MRRLAAALLLIAASMPLHAQWFDWRSPLVPRTPDGRPDLNAPAPKTADGKPDLTGIWVPQDARGTLFDESKIQAWALEVMAERERRFYTDDPRFHCLPSGPSSYPAGASVGGMRRIVQHPELIVVLNSDMTYREIFMDGRVLEEEPLILTWLGYSVGRWEGDTLVVESNGYNEKTWLTREGLPHTEQLRITERYTRLDYGHMKLEITYDDPGTFTEPVHATVDLVHRPDSAMTEVVCLESETSRKHYSGNLDQAEQKVVQVPEEVLRKYVGTYRGVWLGNTITAVVTLENGELYLERTPRYSDTGGNTSSDKSRLVPQSENAFDSSFGLGWVFNMNEDGEVVSVSEVHVSGAWEFPRVE